MADGVVERPERQPLILLRPQTPAQDAPGVAIDDHGQVGGGSQAPAFQRVIISPHDSGRT
jgi:hypothetical protein